MRFYFPHIIRYYVVQDPAVSRALCPALLGVRVRERRGRGSRVSDMDMDRDSDRDTDRDRDRDRYRDRDRDRDKAQAHNFGLEKDHFHCFPRIL